MKKWLVLFLLMLCGLSPAHAGEPVFVQGTCSNANHTVVLTDGSASVACAGVDFSPFIGEWIEWFDSTARPIKGYIGDSSGKIYTTAAAATQNWQWKHASFDNNDASGYSYRIIKSRPMGTYVDGNSSILSGHVSLITTNGSSMVEVLGKDLSVYAGGDNGTVTVINPYSTTGATWHINKYLLVLEDSAGKLATGYIGAAGLGTLGSELITGWSNLAGVNGYETLTSSGSNITSAINSNAYGLAYSNTFTLTSTNLYKFDFNITLNSGTLPSTFSSLNTDNGNAYDLLTFAQASVGSNVRYFISNGTGNELVFWNGSMVAANFSVASVSLKQATDISPFGVHLHAAPNTFTRNMARLDASFDPNAVSKYRIYQIGPSGYDQNLILQESGQPIQLEQNSANLQQEG